MFAKIQFRYLDNIEVTTNLCFLLSKLRKLTDSMIDSILEWISETIELAGGN
jgi:hypothetical protein